MRRSARLVVSDPPANDPAPADRAALTALKAEHGALGGMVRYLANVRHLAPKFIARRLRMELAQVHALLGLAAPPAPAERPTPATTGLGNSLTIGANQRLTRREKAEAIPYPDDIERPRTRGECVDQPRPCPWVSCRHHLYLDVNKWGGLQINFPGLDVTELAASCALDVADASPGGLVLEEVSQYLNVTRERVRQVEEDVLRQLSDELAPLEACG